MTNIKRKRRSIIWKMSNEDFIELVKKSLSMKNVLAAFNMKSKGNNFQTAKSRINELCIDTSHFLSRVEISNISRTLSLEDFKDTWLIENKSRNRTNLKKYLVKFGLLKYECSKCNNSGEWMGVGLTLQLEHINGISDDNRLENLCFLCPNCHSQTSSYAGRNNKKYKYCDCGETIKSKQANRCLKCGAFSNRKISWQSKEYFEEMLWLKPTSKIAEELHISDKAVEKHVKKLGLTKPPRGYWQKMAAMVGIEPDTLDGSKPSVLNHYTT